MWNDKDKCFIHLVGTANHLGCNLKNCGMQKQVDVFPANGSFSCLPQLNSDEMQTKQVSLLYGDLSQSIEFH